MSNMVIQIPKSIENWGPLLEMFVRGMIYKLDKNSYKSTPTINTIPEIVDLLRSEVEEFEDQLLENRYDENSLIELMDASNFAFLAYVVLRNEGVEHVSDLKPAG